MLPKVRAGPDLGGGAESRDHAQLWADEAEIPGGAWCRDRNADRGCFRAYSPLGTGGVAAVFPPFVVLLRGILHSGRAMSTLFCSCLLEAIFACTRRRI